MIYPNLNSEVSEAKKTFILLEFTRELIKQSGEEIFELENIVQDEYSDYELSKKPPLKEKKKIVPKKTLDSHEQLKRNLDSELFKKTMPRPPMGDPHPLFIPKPRLPAKFNYLRPTPSNVEVDLGRLNPLLNDPLIRNIECNGPGENVMVIGTMGRKKTNIFLNEVEVEEVVKRFSKATKIPFHEGVFRVVAGRLIFSAIVSPNIGSKFLIKKMIYDPRFRR